MAINPIDTTAINRQLMPNAILRLADPGSPRNLNMATGIVVNSARTKISDAPNSPIDTANAKVAPTNKAGAIKGSSTSMKIFEGVAPSTAAPSLRLGFMPLSTGRRLRMTKGYATRLWAITSMNHDPRKSNGGRPSAMM